MKAVVLILFIAVAVLAVLRFQGIETGIALFDQPITTFLTSLGF